MCVHECMHVCVHVCVRACVCVHACVRACVCVCVFAPSMGPEITALWLVFPQGCEAYPPYNDNIAGREIKTKQPES